MSIQQIYNFTIFYLPITRTQVWSSCKQQLHKKDPNPTRTRPISWPNPTDHRCPVYYCLTRLSLVEWPQVVWSLPHIGNIEQQVEHVCTMFRLSMYLWLSRKTFCYWNLLWIFLLVLVSWLPPQKPEWAKCEKNWKSDPEHRKYTTSF